MIVTFSAGGEGFLKHIVWILVLFYNTFVNLLWENIRKLNWRNWLCFRLFTFDNAFRWSRVAFVKASFYLKGYWKYCDSKSLSNERNWYVLVSMFLGVPQFFNFVQAWPTVALVYVSTPLFNNDYICFNFTFAFELGTISAEKCFT